MAIHSSKSFEMPLLLSAFSNVLPQVICGQIIGRECDTAPGEVRRGLLLYGRHFSSTGGSAGRWLQRFYTTGGGRFGPIISNYPCFSYVTLTSLARKRTDDSDSEIGWRPAPEKNIETAPCWGKKIAQGIASWTWDVTHERALSPAALFGGKAPVGALIGLLERIC